MCGCGLLTCESCGPGKQQALRSRFRQAINAESVENGSNTPDYVLAQLAVDAVVSYERAARARERWFQNDSDD